MQQIFCFFYDTIYSDKSQELIVQEVFAMKVNVIGEQLSQEEIDAYIEYGKKKWDPLSRAAGLAWDWQWGGPSQASGSRVHFL